MRAGPEPWAEGIAPVLALALPVQVVRVPAVSILDLPVLTMMSGSGQAEAAATHRDNVEPGGRCGHLPLLAAWPFSLLPPAPGLFCNSSPPPLPCQM